MTRAKNGDDGVTPKPHRLARRTDPRTSKGAAQYAVESGLVNEHQRRALNLVRLHPGRTSMELDRLAEIQYGRCDGMARKRLAELERAGLVCRGMERRSEIDGVVVGRASVTWWPA